MSHTFNLKSQSNIEYRQCHIHSFTSFLSDIQQASNNKPVAILYNFRKSVIFGIKTNFLWGCCFNLTISAILIMSLVSGDQSGPPARTNTKSCWWLGTVSTSLEWSDRRWWICPSIIAAPAGEVGGVVSGLPPDVIEAACHTGNCWDIYIKIDISKTSLTQWNSLSNLPSLGQVHSVFRHHDMITRVTKCL